jgi:hypothetical protein
MGKIFFTMINVEGMMKIENHYLTTTIVITQKKK